jgi:pimeloyl-ACP methyl ester carboxylesterase
MSVTAAEAPPQALEALLERYDPAAIDLPRGHARIRLAVTGGGEWDALVDRESAELVPGSGSPDALLQADPAAWQRIERDVRGGMAVFRAGRLSVRHNLSLGVGLLAATSGNADGGLRFARAHTALGEIAYVEAGEGEPLVCLHGLGGTKASFLTTLSALAEERRVIALDLPGFGDSVKPIAAPYDAPWFAQAVVGALDSLGIERAHLAGNSMGGRVALETALLHPDRTDRLVLLCPALAWLRDRRWSPFVRLLRPELGLLQVAPRQVVEGLVRRIVPGANGGWAAAGVDEFLRAFLTPRGRAAFYAAARNIYLDEPQGERGFWTRLSSLQTDSLFVWGRHDQLVPAGFRRHVESSLPAAQHLLLPCGHVPQVEAPAATHAAMRRFLA